MPVHIKLMSYRKEKKINTCSQNDTLSSCFFSHTPIHLQTPNEHNFPFALEESTSCCSRWRGDCSVRGKEWIVWVILLEDNWNGKSNLHAPISPPAPLFIFMSLSSLLTHPLGDSKLNAIINSLSRYTNTDWGIRETKTEEKNHFSGKMTSVWTDASEGGHSHLSLLHSLKLSLVITTKSDSHLHGFCYYVYVFMSVLSLCYSLYEKLLYNYWLGCYREIY